MLTEKGGPMRNDPEGDSYWEVAMTTGVLAKTE